MDLIFTRDRAFYFTTVFIPGIILVTSSFITFWLEWNAVPARVMIGRRHGRPHGRRHPGAPGRDHPSNPRACLKFSFVRLRKLRGSGGAMPAAALVARSLSRSRAVPQCRGCAREAKHGETAFGIAHTHPTPGRSVMENQPRSRDCRVVDAMLSVLWCRVSAGVTTMLNFFTTSNGFRSTLPVVSNLTAMNVWDGVCMCFIYASLLEFVAVNYVGRKRPLHNVVYRPGENPVTQVSTWAWPGLRRTCPGCRVLLSRSLSLFFPQSHTPFYRTPSRQRPSRVLVGPCKGMEGRGLCFHSVDPFAW